MRLRHFNNFKLVAARILRRLQSLAIVLHAQPVEIVFVGRHVQQHPTRTGKATYHVHMPVRLIVFKALIEPDDPAHTEMQRQPFFDLLPSQFRIAVFIEQALLGCQQSPVTIRTD